MPPGAWRALSPAGARRARRATPSSAMCLAHEALDVGEHLVGVEADTEILDAEDAVPIDQRRQERVVHVAARVLPREHAVLALDVSDLRRCPCEKGPARRPGAVRSRIARENPGRVMFRIDCHGGEEYSRAEVPAQPLLEPGELRGEKWTGVRAAGVHEGHGDDLPAKVAERQPRSRLRR